MSTGAEIALIAGAVSSSAVALKGAYDQKKAMKRRRADLAEQRRKEEQERALFEKREKRTSERDMELRKLQRRAAAFQSGGLSANSGSGLAGGKLTIG